MYAFNIKNPSIILVTCETFKKLKLTIFMCINVLLIQITNIVESNKYVY